MKTIGKTKSIIMLSCAAVVFAILIAFTVVFCVLEPSFALFLSGTSLSGATREKGEALATQIVEEGAVLLKNDDCLPLSEFDITVDGKKRVNVFGWSSTQWVMGGSGSGRATNNGSLTNIETDLLKSLTDAGIEYNTELTDMYKSFYGSRPFYTSGTGGGALNVHDYEYCRLIEPPFSTYTDKIKENAESYSDVALVVITRISGESIDCPTVQYKNYTGSGTSSSNGALAGAAVDSTRTYLEISTEEEDLLKYVGANYGKVVVLLNTTNYMNLGFLDDIDGIDSCLLIGGTGVNAANAIPGLLMGEKTIDGETVKISPSGRTVDTFVYDFKTNPSFAYTAMDGVSQYSGLTRDDNMYPFDKRNPGTTDGTSGSGTTNGNVNAVNSNELYPGVSYLDYVEGIYVGYKWYETADAENYWTAYQRGNKTGYDAVVQYPFGYGLSYTSFDWEVRNWTVKDEQISVEVRVVNTGDYPAQEVVQLYFTPPYERGGLEKSAVTLCAFAKTPTAVEPGEDQLLTLTFDVQDMASYDQNRNGGKYVLEDGDYVISLRNDSHNVAQVKSGAATYTYHVSADKEYSDYTGTNGTEEIHNLFVGSNISDVTAIDGSNTDQTIKWLSRENFTTTFSSEKAAARAWNDKLEKYNIYTVDDAQEWETANYTDTRIRNEKNGITIYDNSTKQVNEMGLWYGNPDNYDADAEWDELLNQIPVDEMKNLVLHGYIKENAVPSIGKPETSSVDGPSQIGSFNVPSGIGIGYPNATVLAQSWNVELAKSFGLAVGGETRESNRNGWYAPGVNLHRSAFGGRNYEYYSEDTLLSGQMCAAVVRGALNAGVYTYIKHFIGYDQESMRDGLYCWMTEQTLRETYLRPYKIAIDGGASGIMTSYGRIGAVWSGGSEALLTDLLRNEWGFKGAVLSDYADHRYFMNADQMIRNGGDIWMDGYGWPGTFRTGFPTSSNAFNHQLRNATKHIVYMYLNAAYEENEYVKFVAENGDELVTRSTGKNVFKWWWLVFAAAELIFVAGTAVLALFGTKGLLQAKATESKPANEQASQSNE